MPDKSLAQRLQDEAWRFEFFQAVRLLERIRRAQKLDTHGPRHPVGYDHHPGDESVRFRALASRQFPPGSISSIRDATAETEGEGPVPSVKHSTEMTVAFLGLTGPSGVLPENYLDLLQRRIRLRDYALRDFFDLFNHRTISLFYRAWEKYRFPIAFEREHSMRGGRDRFTYCLLCLVGMGTAKLGGRFAMGDDPLLYNAGHFAHFPRSAIALENLLADHFGVPVDVEQFRGRWIGLEPDDRTLLPARGRAPGRLHRLPGDTALGDRAYDVQGAFRIRLGPLTYEEFSRFLPDGEAFRQLNDMTRNYVGLELDFDVQLLLRADEVPACSPSTKRPAAGRLGWNTWLRTPRRQRPADEPRFNPRSYV